jgi:hypothetical protein
MGKHTTSIGFALALQILVVISFLMMFYVLYANRIEKRAATNQVNFIVDEVAKSVDPNKLIVGIDKKKAISVTENALDSVENTIAKNSTEKPNRTKYAIITIAVIVGLFLIYFVAFQWAKSKGENLSFDNHMGEAIITVIVVAIIETYFLTSIIGKYIYPGDAEMALHIGNSLKTKLKG